MNEFCVPKKITALKKNLQKGKRAIHEDTIFFQKELSDYIEYLKLHGKRESTTKSYERSTHNLLIGFYSSGIRSLSEVRSTDIYAAF